MPVSAVQLLERYPVRDTRWEISCLPENIGEGVPLDFYSVLGRFPGFGWVADPWNRELWRATTTTIPASGDVPETIKFQTTVDGFPVNCYLFMSDDLKSIKNI